MSTADEIGTAAQLACLLEASAPKPGNVSPGRHFRDARYEDFLASAAAIGPALARAGERPLGATILAAVEATARWTRSNTNLGIVLLLAPLARAAALGGSGALRTEVAHVLAASTVDDARDAYAAIRLASPGGLGRAGAQDVADAPSVSLVDAMRLAANRDGIAREYATDFSTTFERGAPSLVRARADGLAWDDAVVETYLTLLAAAPDTHVARRAGEPRAAEVTRDARAVLAAGGVRTAAGRDAVAQFDRTLRDPHNLANPGTTADLTAAALFVVLLDGGWHSTHGDSDDRAR
ncbi:MAG TPA: triphosphoribosyl-dephospho-CoA synthase [Gemmatirosa sp.]